MNDFGTVLHAPLGEHPRRLHRRFFRLRAQDQPARRLVQPVHGLRPAQRAVAVVDPRRRPERKGHGAPQVHAALALGVRRPARGLDDDGEVVVLVSDLEFEGRLRVAEPRLEVGLDAGPRAQLEHVAGAHVVAAARRPPVERDLGAAAGALRLRRRREPPRVEDLQRERRPRRAGERRRVERRDDLEAAAQRRRRRSLRWCQRGRQRPEPEPKQHVSAFGPRAVESPINTSRGAAATPLLSVCCCLVIVPGGRASCGVG